MRLFVAALLLVGTSRSLARAASSDTEDDDTTETVKPKTRANKRGATHKTVTEEPAEEVTPKAPAKASAKPPTKVEKPSAEASADDAKPSADEGATKGADPSEKDSTKDEEAEEAETQKPAVAKPPAFVAPGMPLSVQLNGWTAAVYGFAELDIIQDSTQSFVEGSLNMTVARPNTLAGGNPRTQLTARNSRFGFQTTAPTVGGVRASATMEVDFYGNQPLETTQNDFYMSGPMRMRLFYLKLETPIVDVIAGQYHDLFGWGGGSFYPNTVAYLPVLGEVYHRNPQLRVSKTVGGEGTPQFQIAGAVVRPPGRDSGVPDGQGGVRLAVPQWSGGSSPGAGRPRVSPLSLGVSGVFRHLVVNDFSVTPQNPQTANAWGAALDLFLPIIPASGQNLSNTLSFVAEATIGTGIADLYPGLTGGVGFPQLPNPNNDLSVPTYIPNIDPGIATFDASASLRTVNWQTIMVNLQYRLPIAAGRKVWISGTYGRAHSTNVAELVPQAGRQLAWDTGQYADGNLWFSLTPSVQAGASVQWTQQTFLDGVKGANLRGEGSLYMFF